MIRLTQRLTEKPEGIAPSGVLSLTFDERKRGRLSAETTCGKPVGLFLERGRTLQDGEWLATDEGQIYRLEAAPEPVIEARGEDWESFSRVCYHLGNRHVPLQVGRLWLRFQPDHVLEDLVKHYGLQTEHVNRPFQPESGAYGSHTANNQGHHHGHHHHAHHHEH